MYQKTIPLLLFCESATHVGSGADLGIVDMPIQRERHTGFPKIEGSSLKGALRQAFENQLNINKETVPVLFGPEDAGSDARMGSVGFSDARLLLFPVKSHKGVFAWVTCPRVIDRFVLELKTYCKYDEQAIRQLKEMTTGNDSSILFDENRVGLEEYLYDPVSKNQAVTNFGNWLGEQLFDEAHYGYWKEKIGKDIIVLPDEEFAYFVQYSTEVITRNKIDSETGTAADTGLFTEEYLPSESILYSLIMFSREFREGGKEASAVEGLFRAKLPSFLQIGGNTTLGKGIVKTNGEKLKLTLKDGSGKN